MHIKLFFKYCVSDQTNEMSAIGAIFIILIFNMEIATAKYVKIILYTYLNYKFKKLTCNNCFGKILKFLVKTTYLKYYIL